MAKKTVEELKARICETACWRTQVWDEAGVVADLGAPWRLFLLDHHFSECVSPGKTVGGLCDVVAAWPQDNNNKLKLIELKSNLRNLPQAKDQLREGGELVHQTLPSGFKGLEIQAECHVKQAQISTLKVRDYIKIAGRRVPLRAFREGKPV